MTTLPRSATWRLAERDYPGDLAARLRQLKSERQPLEKIAQALFRESDGKISVTSGAIRGWLRVLAGDPPKEKAG